MSLTRDRLIGLFLALMGTLAISQMTPAHAAKNTPNTGHAFDIVSGGSQKGVWAVRLQGGYPWQAIQVQTGLAGGWTPLLEVDTALFVRTRPSIGLGLRWLDTGLFRLSGEVLVGWDIQTGELALQGPSIALRLRLSLQWSHRVAVFMRLDTRHTFLLNQVVTDTPNGNESTPVVEHRWSPWGSLGIAIRLFANVSLDLEIAYPWIDAPSIGIPAFHLGIQASF
jgi:hypothetical protein